MLEFTPVFEFSRHHCIAICAFLVPANLLATLQTLSFVILERPRYQIYGSVAIATFFALTLSLHVGTWLAIGIVRAVTFILLGLASACLLLNWGILSYQNRCAKLSSNPLKMSLSKAKVI